MLRRATSNSHTVSSQAIITPDGLATKNYLYENLPALLCAHYEIEARFVARLVLFQRSHGYLPTAAVLGVAAKREPQGSVKHIVWE